MKTTRTTMIFASLLIAGCDTGVQQTLTPPAGPPTIAVANWPALASPLPADPELEKAVDELLGRMSVEEKVGQVIQAEIRQIEPEEVGKYHLGSVLNGGGGYPGNDKYSTVADWLALADAFWEASMDTSDGGVAIPVIWGVDAVHGHNNVIGATIFPHNIGLGAAGNPELIRRIGAATAREVAVTGLDWNFGPTVAVARDDRWGRAYESYSEDPEIVAAYAGQMVEGLQGEAGSDDFLGAHHVISTAKHFVGDGGTEGGVDQGENFASEAELRDLHAAGYVTALTAGVQVVMASYNAWHGRKMHGRADLLTAVLKQRMGFDGFVVGDWNGHGQVAGCSAGSCAAAFNAGVDMFMVPKDWKALYGNTLAQVGAGEIAAERLDDAVRRILRVKMRAGLFERGRPSRRPLAGRTEILGSPEHRALARRAVRESLVLLKNEDGLLPLAPDSRVLVAGDGAEELGKQTGGWTLTWQGTGNKRSDFPNATTIWEGIKGAVEAAGGTAVLSPKGRFDGKPDVAVVVFGEGPYAEMIGDVESIVYRDRRNLELLEELGEAGVPVVSVFLSGRPLWVNPELNASDAFVAAWLPGTEGGGVADVIFRAADGSVAHDFKGKLSFSWPKETSQTVLNRNDPDYDPLFPYGFGLTYADDGALAELSEEIDVTTVVASRRVYFEGGPVPPWQLYASEKTVVRAVDREEEEDARSVTWSGEGPAKVYLQAAEPVDISRETNAALALAFDVLVEQAPSSTVAMSMECGEGCSSELDVTEIVTALPAGEWRTLRIRLDCFADAGADMTKIDTPFLIATDGALALTFSDVELVTEAEGEVICPLDVP